MTLICGSCGSKTFRLQDKNYRAVCSDCGQGWSVTPDIIHKTWSEQNILDLTDPEEIKIVDISGPSIKYAPPPHLRKPEYYLKSKDIEWERRKKKSTKPKPKRKVCRCKK